MAEWINDYLLRGDDGNIYEQVDEDQFVPYTGALPGEQTTEQPTKQLITDEESPEASDVAKGLAADVAISTAGQGLGMLTGPFYPVVAFSSGVLGNIVGQYIEGRDEISLGRAATGGTVNMLPFSSAVKVGKGTKITGELIKKATTVEAKRGAAIGAGEATAVSIIDNGRLPTATELAEYGGLGALFGAPIGALSPKFAKSFSKLLGKSADDIDEAVASGEIGTEDVIRMGLADNDLDAQRILEDTIDNVATKQVAKTLRNARDSQESSAWERTKAWLFPSKTTGREAQDIAFYGRSEVKANTELASKLSDRINKFQTNNPTAAKEINKFLDNPDIELPKSLKGTAIEGDLNTFRKTLVNLQAQLLDQLSEHKFSNLSPDHQKELIATIQNSLKPDRPNYVTKEYRLFTDPNFKPDPRLKQEAIDEIADGIMAKNPKMSPENAYANAEKHIQNLINNSAKNRELATDRQFFGSTDSVLKARSNPGEAERAFLGEIVDPAERIRGTLDNVGRLVYKNKSDIAMANALQKAGLAFKQVPSDTAFTKLKLRGNLDSGLYVPNTVQYALDKTYLNTVQERGADVLREAIQDLYETGVGLSKATKVILNPPSYAVNMWGGMATILGSGINPLSVAYGRGLKLALAEYGSVDKILAGNKAATREAMNEAMKDMTKYGISNANIIASDIRSSFKGGFFSEKINKAFEPISKAYQATDTAARFTVWTANQERLGKMFPNLKGDDLKLAAAKLTNDTYQNYDKLSNAIRILSRTGIMPQFVSFTAEFMRNIYNQTRYAMQMVKGTFGAELGIDMSQANKAVMRAEGIKRLTALSALIAGTEAARQAYNASNGVDEETEKALKETVVADFDKSKSLLFTRDPKTGEISYANLSYLVPHAMVAEAFNAATSDQPLESLAGILSDNFVGEGTFVAQSAIQAINNVDANGKPISDAQGRFQKFKDQLDYFAAEAFKPGVAREAEKLIETATKEDPRYSFKELAERQLGHRINKIDVADNSFFKVRDANEKAQRSASKYKQLLEYGNPTPEQAREAYLNAENLRKQNIAVVAKHYNNLVKLGLPEDKRIEVMKNAGVSSRDIIAIIEDTYIPLPTTLKQDTKEIYDERYQGKSFSEVMRDISKNARANPALAERLRNEATSREKQKRSNMSAKEVLLKNLNTQDRAKYVIANPDKLQELLRKGIVTKAVIEELRSTPEGKAVLSRRGR
jgi:hypothetical protein